MEQKRIATLLKERLRCEQARLDHSYDSYSEGYRDGVTSGIRSALFYLEDPDTVKEFSQYQRHSSK